MTVTLRFAPSPTGFIHVGNIRTALMNALLARQHNGTFYLRLDDTDTVRSTDEFANAIQQDLKWLGLNYDDTFRQSDRMARYDEIKQTLIDAGRLYPCYETADELERKRKRQLSKSLAPVYDRAALNLSDAEKTEFETSGRTPHWRFKLDLTDIHFHDLIRGDVRIDARSVSDPVLIREDGSYLYTLCSVIDDMDYHITHIVRGEDHVTNTAVQIQIFAALNAKIPTFAHHPLLTDDKGEKLSKRIGGLSVKSLREQGLEPMTILSYLARIGTSDSVEPRTNIADIASGFDIGRTSNSPARFVNDDMFALNAQICALYDYEQIKTRLHAICPDADMDFWNGVKFNIKYFSDVKQWYDIIYNFTPVKSDIAQHDFLKTALDILPDAGTENFWKIWTKSIAEKTGRKGKDLFMPLRYALTAMEHGPEMAVIITLLGRDKIIQRIQNTF